MLLQLAEPAIRAESEGLLGHAWRGVAAKVGQETKRRQASTAFAALYDERQPERAEPHDEDSKQDKEGRPHRQEGENERIGNDGSTPVHDDQDRRDKPDNTDENRDESSQDSAVTCSGGREEVCMCIARGEIYYSVPEEQSFYLTFARTGRQCAQRRHKNLVPSRWERQ